MFRGFEDGLVERILADVRDEPGKLTLLEFSLTQLWERSAQGNGRLTKQAYNDIGGVQGSLNAHAEEVFSCLSPTEQGQARRLFTQLVKPGPNQKATRHPVTRAELGEDNWKLAEKLADKRLVITRKGFAEPEPGESTQYIDSRFIPETARGRTCP
jgi:hypothetical protein